MPTVSGAAPQRQSARAVVEAFLASAGRPAILEPGEAPLALEPGCYSLEVRASALTLHAWNTAATWCRKIVEAVQAHPGRIELTIERFGQKAGTVSLVDLDRPRNHAAGLRSGRQVFRERFRRMLSRQFPGWRVGDVSSEPDLEHSLSPAYSRATLRRGTSMWAAIGCPPESDSAAALTFGLIWLAYVRERESKSAVQGLVLFVPAEAATPLTLRLRWIDGAVAPCELFVYADPAIEDRLDAKDWGNLDTNLEEHDTRRQVARTVATPEAELEVCVRGNLPALDASLLREPVYRQTPAFAGQHRGLMDLLAIDIRGRLAVIELKASEDIHLPLQALDYWMRVAWHLEHGDFERRGYFPGIPISRESPLLFLVAPALEFHPATGTILAALDPRIEVVRLGVSSAWRAELKVISRQES